MSASNIFRVNFHLVTRKPFLPALVQQLDHILVDLGGQVQVLALYV